MSVSHRIPWRICNWLDPHSEMKMSKIRLLTDHFFFVLVLVYSFAPGFNIYWTGLFLLFVRMRMQHTVSKSMLAPCKRVSPRQLANNKSFIATFVFSMKSNRNSLNSLPKFDFISQNIYQFNFKPKIPSNHFADNRWIEEFLALGSNNWLPKFTWFQIQKQIWKKKTSNGNNSAQPTLIRVIIFYYVLKRVKFHELPLSICCFIGLCGVDTFFPSSKDIRLRRDTQKSMSTNNKQINKQIPKKKYINPFWLKSNKNKKSRVNIADWLKSGPEFIPRFVCLFQHNHQFLIYLLNIFDFLYYFFCSKCWYVTIEMPTNVGELLWINHIDIIKITEQFE